MFFVSETLVRLMNASELVTRDRLAEWGFIQLKDSWLYSREHRRHEYFETWYQPDWNHTSFLGWGEDDPLTLEIWQFLQRVRDRDDPPDDDGNAAGDNEVWSLLDEP